MPSRRFEEQKWALDSVIEQTGLDWDQLRRTNTLLATGYEAAADYDRIERSVTRFDEISPRFAQFAQRRLQRAHVAAEAGNLTTARENYFVAALFFGWAQWPLHTPGSVANEELNRLKVESFEQYAALASHHVERVELSLDGKLLPAWLHIPAGATEPCPTLILVPGMDTFKELQVGIYGDKFLERGFAVLAVDGPGQSEAMVHGLTVDPRNVGQAAAEWLDFIDRHERLDETRVGVYGRSFGSYLVTVIAAEAGERLHGVAGALVVHEPRLRTLMEGASPSFKARFMYMTGHEEETAFDEFVQGFTLEDLADRIEVPYLAVAGELDQLSPVSHTESLLARIPPPRELLVYADERHAIGRSEAAFNGPHWHTYIADWLHRTVALGETPQDSRYRYVLPSGECVERPFQRVGDSA